MVKVHEIKALKGTYEKLNTLKKQVEASQNSSEIVNIINQINTVIKEVEENIEEYDLEMEENDVETLKKKLAVHEVKSIGDQVTILAAQQFASLEINEKVAEIESKDISFSKFLEERDAEVENKWCELIAGEQDETLKKLKEKEEEVENLKKELNLFKGRREKVEKDEKD